MKPTLTYLYSKTCWACKEALPEFKKLSQMLPNWQFNMLDLDAPGVNLDFPVNYTPTLHLRLGARRYTTDPKTLGRDFTAENMQLWLQAAVKKWKSEGSPR